MQEKNFEVLFFTLPDGSCPIKDFLDSLNPKMQAKAYSLLEILAESGSDLREPYSKPLGDGIFELRVRISTDITRVLYFFYIGRRIIVTNGFVKKTQKTPKSEMEKAKKYRKLFEESMQGKEGKRPC